MAMLQKRLLAIALLIFLFAHETRADRLGERLASISERYGNDEVGISIIDQATGESVFERGANRALAPASIQKVITAAAALSYLGPEYSFKTEVWIDGPAEYKLERAYIVGAGDPSLTLESMWLLARKFRRFGIRQVGELFLDQSPFISSRTRVGQRAYETGASALAFNFNSIGFQVCPGKPGQAADVQIDPWEAPIRFSGRISTGNNSGATFSIDDDRTGGFALAGSIGATRACSQIYRSVSNPTTFFGESLKAIAHEIGVSIGRVNPGTPRNTSTLLFVHPSKPLRLIVEDMNHFSNNFVAEQILFAIGAEPGGGFDRERGLDRLREYLQAQGVRNEGLVLKDASGLSRENRLSAKAVTTVLRAASQDESFGVEFVSSFSVSRRNGTLRERDFENGTFVRGKTGTLNGVSSLAGFVRSRTGRHFAFAFIQNGSLPKSRVAEIENRLVQELYANS